MQDMCCRDDLAVVLKRQLQAQSRMPYQSTGCTQQQMLVDLSQGIAGALCYHQTTNTCFRYMLLPFICQPKQLLASLTFLTDTACTCYLDLANVHH